MKESERKTETKRGERRKEKILERKGICQAFEVAGTFGVDGWSFSLYTERDFDLLLFSLKGN